MAEDSGGRTRAETAPVSDGAAVTRRLFLGLAAAPLAAQNSVREWRKYLDPATEFEVILLTDPQYESAYPGPPALAVDRRSRTLVYSSRRTGQWQPWVLDLSTGVSRQAGARPGYVRETLTLSAGGREVVFGDGEHLLAVQLSSLRQRQLASLSPGAEWAGPVAPSLDGTALFYVEKREGRWRLLRLPQPRGVPAEVAVSDAPMLEAAPNPRRAMVLWRTPAGMLEVSAFDGTLRRRLETPPGRVLEAHWSPDGQAVVYLHEAAGENAKTAIREQGLDSREDRLVAPTSQFGRFARNANGTVFLGASRSLASPLVLVLLRVNRREFPLCEHRASDVALVEPLFTPDSQKILFVSDRLGKPAIFVMNVEKLIEKTDS